MKILKKLTGMILAVIMATSCLMLVNVVSTMGMTQNNRVYDWLVNSVDYRTNKGEYSNDRTIFPDAAGGGGGELASGATNGYWVYGKKYNLTYYGGSYQYKIVVPDFAVNASFTMIAKCGRNGDYTDKITLSKEDGTVVGDTKTLTQTPTLIKYENLEAGETYIVASDWYIISYPLLALNVTYNCYNISGTVSDEDGNAIPRATVSIGEDTVIRTDKGGNYSVEYMAGAKVDTIMKVTAVGYEDKEVPLSTTDDCTVDFTLSKKGVNEVSVYNYFMGSTDASNNYDTSVTTINARLYQFTEPSSTLNDKTISETTYNVGGSSYKLTTFVYKKNIQITIPSGVTNAKFYMVVYGGYNYELLQNGVVLGEKMDDGAGIVSFDGLSTGVYNLEAVNANAFPISLLVLEDKSSETDTHTNVTNSVTAVDNGLVSDIASDSPFTDMVTGLNSTDKLFTLVGVVNSERSSSQFANEINQVGFMLYDADVVDALGESAKTKNPQQLNSNYTASDFKEAVIQTDEVYKNFYDAENYNKDLDSDTEYTGATSQDSSSSKSYFAYVVALGQGKRYYAYPYTLYNGASQNTYDTVVNDRIEISNN